MAGDPQPFALLNSEDGTHLLCNSGGSAAAASLTASKIQRHKYSLFSDAVRKS